jgi:site-specific recombinase XerD
MKLSEAIEEFLIACEADGLAPKTLEWYDYHLKKFSRLMDDCSLDQITTRHAREFLVYLRENYSGHTYSGANRTLHRFWRWCGIEYGVTNIMRNVKYIQPPAPTEARAVATEDIVKMFDAVEAGIIGHRDKAILAFLIDTGVRVGGLARLTIDNLNLEDLRAIVHEKGRKSRVVYFSKFTGRLLERWLKIRTVGSQSVFYNLRTGEGLTVSGLQQMLKRLKGRAGVTGRANPHAFRHAFGKDYVKAGGDIATLSRLMGHADIKLTMKFYLWFVVNKTASEHKIFPTTDLILDMAKREE